VNATNPNDCDSKGRPYPAIHCAYAHYKDQIDGHEFTDLLLASGASVDTPSPEGNTPLMRSVGHGQAKLVEYYLSKVADPMRPCAGGKFPLQVLQESTSFKPRTKTKLLALMMKNVRPGATPQPSASSAVDIAPSNVELSHDIGVQKPLSIKRPTLKPAVSKPRRFEL
jgi:ankyrin repeat protein